MNLALNINQLCVSYEQQEVLSGINLTLQPGEIMGLLGPSGCGKTTLLNTIAGFIHQQSGAITISDEIHIIPERAINPEHRHVGMIFQDYALFPHLTVAENITFGLKQLNKAEQVSKVEHLLSLLHLPLLAERYPHELSGGQQQRVAIARALAHEPKLLLLDEPFSNIDARLRNGLMLELRKLLKSLNISAIFVTHNKDEVFVFADKMAIMEQGKILQADSPALLCESPASMQVADFLQLGTLLPALYCEQGWQTEFGLIARDHPEKPTVKEVRLLLKPQHLMINKQAPANAKVTNITISELGFKTTLTALNKPELEIHLFHQTSLMINEEVNVTIKTHSPITFPTEK